LKDIGVETLVLDVTNSDNIKDLKAKISELTGGSLDVLVNNAGIAYPYAVSDFSMDRVQELYNVNVFGAIEMAHEFIPLLVKSGDARIVQIGSLAGLMPVPFNAAYNSSKAALHSFSDTMRVELAPFGVKVINVAAGNVGGTNIMKPEALPADSIYDPVREDYQTNRLDKFQDGGAPLTEFAKTIVSETLKKNPKAWLWAGTNAWKCWLMNTFGTRTSFDSLLSDMFCMTKLASIRKKEAKS